MVQSTNRIRLKAEWENQRAILIVFPHKNSDWNSCLDIAEIAFVRIVNIIRQYSHIYLLCDDVLYTQELFTDFNNLTFIHIKTNDTWIRDFGPIGVEFHKTIYHFDFEFNAWGGKFSYDLDNKVSKKLYQKRKIKNLIYKKFILEGGSIDSDGDGVILTNHCLTTRHPELSKSGVVKKLEYLFDAKKILFLNHGYLVGDDTDSHIDTLARFINPTTIAYTYCDRFDVHFKELNKMKKELERFTTRYGERYTLVPLYIPSPIMYQNRRLPASYVNFLITNDVVFVPMYNDENDLHALKTLQVFFPKRKIVGIDARLLIRQGGSLHCSTMQLY